MITMFHSNLARVEGGRFFVDRKFHTGMRKYVEQLSMPVLSVHRHLPAKDDATVMDLVELPEDQLGYSVLTFQGDRAGRPLAEDMQRLRARAASSRLVYGDLPGRRLAAELRIPYVAIVEYNLQTTMTFASEGTTGTWRRRWRSAKAARTYFTCDAPAMRAAALLHCNGYPIYEESSWLNGRRLLYLDSRMARALIIPEAELFARLAARSQRLPRLLFSGRFEPAKGALDVVKVAAECARRGAQFEMHLYGKGSQREAMDRAVVEHGLQGRVTIHDPVPFTELVQIARSSDLFVCCHVQDDPSCTYLESLGCGLPVVGYDNAMWRGLAEHSRAGIVTPLRSPSALAEKLTDLLTNHAQLNTLSDRARTFALEHCFENEFTRRTSSLEALCEVPAA
jgi:colanic acid/amylovoran biosynthesis glycosyltransferase